MSFADALLTAAEEYRREMGERDGLQARVRALEDALRVAEEALDWGCREYHADLRPALATVRKALGTPATFGESSNTGHRALTPGNAGSRPASPANLEPPDPGISGGVAPARQAKPGASGSTSPPPRGAQEGGTCFHAYTMFEPSLGLYRCISCHATGTGAVLPPGTPEEGE